MQREILWHDFDTSGKKYSPMLRNILLACIIGSVSLSSCAQVSVPSSSEPIKKDTKISGTTSSPTTTPSTSTPSSSSTSPSGGILGQGSDQIVNGLKEALSLSAINSSSILSIANGFYENAAIKILMPPDAKLVESKLRAIGLGAQVDELILSMNRAAETAAKDAAPIFVGAIKSMSFTDAMGIVKGPNDAATQYLKQATTAQLNSKFRPVIQSALQKVDATKYWSDIFSTYNQLPFVQPVNADLTAYVTEKALNGLFYTMAQQEAKIRMDPAATANDLINIVFGKK
jgi:hypothetical protein